jgi:Flp pilus assembly protein TadG
MTTKIGSGVNGRQLGLWLWRARRDDGAMAVEFALVVPLLLTVLFAILQFGLTLNNEIQLTDSIREGARAFAISRAVGNPVTAAKAAITNSAPSLMPIANVNPQFSVNGAPCTTDTLCSAAMTAGAYAKVTGTYTCNLTVMGVNFAPGCQLSANTTDLVE